MLRYDTSRLSLLVFSPPAGRVAASPSSPSSSSVRSGLRAWLWAAQKEIESRLLRFRLDPRKGPTMEGSLQRRRRRRTAGGSARLVCISPRPPLFLPSDVAFSSFSPFSPSLFLVRCPHLTKVFLKSTREGAASIFCSPFPPPRIRQNPKVLANCTKVHFFPSEGDYTRLLCGRPEGKKGGGKWAAK